MAAAALVISGANVSSAAAEETPAAGNAQASGDTVQDAILEGASSDGAAIAVAAEEFEASDPASAVELTSVASAAEGVTLQPTSGGLVGSDAAGGGLVLTEEGATLTMGGESYGLAPVGGSGEGSVVDGAVVHSEVAPSTDVVTRAIEGGVQLAAVLADDAAPDRVDFALDLPQGAQLSPNADGTIAVTAPVEVVEPLPGEEARIDAEVAAILGDVQDDTEITDAQWAALDAVAPAATTTTMQTQEVATIGAAWAVDANGAAVPTRYEIDGTTLTQVVETGTATAYPVVADPSFWWWAWTAGKCVANLASFIFAAAKLAGLASKLSSIAKRSSALSSLISKVGGATAFIRNIYDIARGWVAGNVHRYVTRTVVAIMAGAGGAALSLAEDALGVGSCFALVREM